MKKERIAGIDIIKALAALFVVSIHQLGQTHILAMDMAGARAFVIMLYRYMVMSCVPLFIMATGYLQCRKTADKRFYRGIIPVIVTYLFTTVICVGVGYLLGDEMTVGSVIVKTLNFTQNGYAWYVEMFIGLYLMIPFINMACGGTKRQRLIFIGVLAFLTILPSVPIVFSTDNYWFDITPDYWSAFYPVLYYAAGAYIREYQPKINKGINLLLIAAAILMPTATEFIKAGGGEFVDYVFNGFNSLSAFLIAVFIFLFFYNMDIKCKPIKAVVVSVSSCTLELYLLSFLVERGAYSFFNGHFGTAFPLRLWVMIAVVFVGSYAAALVVKGIYAIVGRIIKKNDTPPDTDNSKKEEKVLIQK